MLEPFRYGIIVAAALAVLLLLQVHMEWYGLTLLRWAFGTLGCSLLVVNAYRRRQPNGFTFRLAWFAGFTVWMAAALSLFAVISLLGPQFLTTIDITNHTEAMQLAFIEVVSQLFFALLFLTGSAWLMTLKRS